MRLNRALTCVLSLGQVRLGETFGPPLVVRDAPARRVDTTPHPAGRDAERKLVTAIGVVAFLGVAVATYLTYVHYAGIKPICSASGGCEKVQSSDYSKLAGVPVAVLGLASY